MNINTKDCPKLPLALRKRIRFIIILVVLLKRKCAVNGPITVKLNPVLQLK